METDREVLVWLHQRAWKIHGEKELSHYMRRLLAIIASTPEDRTSPPSSFNSIHDVPGVVVLIAFQGIYMA